MQNRTLILLSCSRGKTSGGGPYDHNSQSRQIESSLPKTGGALFQTRRQILWLLAGGAPRLKNDDQSAGFRDQHPVNKRLIAGRDFAQNNFNRSAYMPAFQRYNGRFFSKLQEADRDFWTRLDRHSMEILFVSGLYGLLLWDEPIQDYDCHLADYTANDSRTSVSDIWRPTLTGALCDFVRNADPPFSVIYDLLSDSLYQGTIDWERVSGCDVKIRHRIFKGISDAEILSALADTFLQHLALFYPGGPKLKRDDWLPLSLGDNPRYVGFETELGSTELRDARDSLIASKPYLQFLTGPALDALAVAELGWRTVKRASNFDLGLPIISYSKAVETYFRSDPSWHCGGSDDLKKIASAVAAKGLPELEKAITKLNENFRKPASHGNRKFTNPEVEDARKLAFTIVERAEHSRRETREQKPR